MKENTSIRLKNLDTIRALACIAVLIHHIEAFKNMYKLKNYFSNDWFQYTGGHIGVILFFTLSGFLITHLLLQEKEKQNNISVGKFYMRRVLRIWPVYFLVILLSFLLVDFSPSTLTLVLTLTFMPNIAHGLGIGWMNSPPVWSIGVEEQYYIFWPWLFKIKIQPRKIIFVLIVIVLFLSILPHLVLFILSDYNPSENMLENINGVFRNLKFQCMAIGGISAILLKNKTFISKLNYNIWVSCFICLFPFLLWLYGFHLKFFTDEVYSIFFSLSLLILVTNNYIYIDTRLSKEIGKISYGIYMYHWIILVLFFKSDYFGPIIDYAGNLFIYPFLILSTFGIAFISYYFYEKLFLKMKIKYSSE